MSEDNNHDQWHVKRRGAVSYLDEEEMLYGVGDVDDDIGSTTQRVQPSSFRSKDFRPSSGSSDFSVINDPHRDSDAASSASRGGSRGLLRLPRLATTPLHMPHPFGGAVSGPLKNISIGKGEMPRVSALKTSGLDDSDAGFDESLIPGAESEWSMESATNISDERAQDDAMREIDQVLNNSSKMYSMNEDDASCSGSARRESSSSYASEEGDANVAKWPIHSREYASADHRRLSSESSSTAETQFENGPSKGYHLGGVGAALPTANEQYERRIRAKMEQEKKDRAPAKKPSPSIENQGVASGTANDQFEGRLRAKTVQGGGSNTAGSKLSPGASSGAANEQFEGRLRAKMALGERSKASRMLHRATLESIGESSASAYAQFESRLRSKMTQGKNDNAGGLKYQPDDSLARADEQFESRLKDKMAQGKTGNAAKMKYSPSMESADGSTDATDGQFEGRLGAKMAQANKDDNAGMKYSPSSQGVGAFAATANEQFESRMRAKMAQREKSNSAGMKYSPSSESVGAIPATANDQFEGRLRAKAAQGEKNNTPGMKHSRSMESVGAISATANDQFEGRLRAKAAQGKKSNTAGLKYSPSSESVGATSATATEQFESRMRAKMAQGEKSNSAGMKYSPSMESVGASSAAANDQFEGRLRAKAAQGGKSNAAGMNHSPSLENIGAEEQFESRLRAKMTQGRNDKTAGLKYQPSSESIDDSLARADQQFDSRLKDKMAQGKTSNAANMKYSPSTESLGAPTATAVDQFEVRLRAKLAQDNISDDTATKLSSSIGSLGDSHHDAASVSSRHDSFGKRIREKLEMGNNGHATASYTDVNRKNPPENDADTDFITKCCKEGRCNDILQFLHDKPRSTPGLVAFALEKTSDSFSMSHALFDSTDRKELQALRGDWVQLLTVATSDHSANEAVQFAALRAILAIVAFSSQHALEFTSDEEGLELLTKAMETHQRSSRIQELGLSIVLSCISSNELSALVLLRDDKGAFVERMVGLLYSNSCSALCALFQLLMTCHQSGESSECLIETIAGYQGADILTNAMDRVLSVMSNCPKHTGVQFWGNHVLWALFSDDLYLGSSLSKEGLRSVSILANSLLYHLEAITSTPAAPLAVHESTICLLSQMSGSRKGRLDWNSADVSRIVVRVMLAQPKSRVVAVHGCHCISDIMYIEKNTTTAILGILQNFHDVELVDIAINSMALLTENGFESKFALLQDEKLISSIVGTMIRHPDSLSIQIASCDILTAVSLNRHVISEICAVGGANRIIANLYTTRQDSVSACKAFVALSNIIGICDAAILHESRAPRSVLSAMEANPTDICIQIRGATILWNLGSCDATLKREIVQLGGIRTICGAMQSFIASERMQEKGILALWVLSVSERLERAVISRTIEAIADAIAAHLTSSKICEHGLGAMSTLASCKSVVKSVDTVIDLIMSCMWMHSDSATVQQGALAALSKITVDQPSNQVLQVTEDDINVVTTAMQRHLYVKGVQENAIILLRSLTFSPINTNALGQNPFLVGLIKSAMTNFQGTLRVSGEGLLRLIPSDRSSVLQ